MLAKFLIISDGQSIQSFGYNDLGEQIYHINEGVKPILEAIYKVRINSLNKKSKFAYIDYAPNVMGIVNLKNANFQAGSSLLAQLTWPGDGKKLPKFSEDIKLLGKYVILLPNETRHSFSKSLKSSLGVVSEKYLGIGMIFRSSIDSLSNYALVENEIKFLIRQAEELKSCEGKLLGLLSSPTYKFMQLLREAKLAPAMKIYTNNAEIFDYLQPYLNLWQINPVNLDKLLIANDYASGMKSKTYAEFALEIHKLSGINLIDINSKNAPLSFYQVNYLAIDEIVRQIWLRDLTGIILLDFIKNMSFKQQEKITDKINQYFANDWRKNQVLGFTQAGIFEIIRNK